jgi:S-adenosylmethionine:diacylglycerol 3-amino-3-carboxypropyl transferase
MLLEQLDAEAIRTAFLVSACSGFLQVKAMLPQPVQEFWALRGELLDHGLNNCGIIDRHLLRAIRLFRLLIHHEAIIRQMLTFDDLQRQITFYETRWQSWRWQWCLRALANLTLLGIVYGRTILDQLPADFARHIGQQIESAFIGSLSISNPYLWQTFMPHVPPADGHMPYHLQWDKIAACKRALPRFTCIAGDAAKVMARTGMQFDFVALSNILEVISLDDAETLADVVGRHTNLGAVVLLRFFFPPPKQLLAPFSRWLAFDADLSLACAKADRGLFCKNIYVYRGLALDGEKRVGS